ncbi:hypothetical protein BJ508DRAFT_330114 [Ascobolus immersus RN42]|uniref:YDG domain-containing protein n=1 Tax=Ascobolus immersus RN42 TaxID=1160509 RepID=A0A3N4HWD4_ASCIM|nr:hypothetical protein BJ508DRAFT_330114 [Ascobolus immersus RN42]
MPNYTQNQILGHVSTRIVQLRNDAPHPARHSDFKKKFEAMIYNRDNLTPYIIDSVHLPDQLFEIIGRIPDPDLRRRYLVDAQIARERWRRGVMTPDPNQQYINLTSRVKSRVGSMRYIPGEVFRNKLHCAFVGTHEYAYRFAGVGAAVGALQNYGAHSVVTDGGEAPFRDREQEDGEAGPGLYFCKPIKVGQAWALAKPSPAAPLPTLATRLLERAFYSNNPVRVLRKRGTRRTDFAPVVGVRYDGLYRITSKVGLELDSAGNTTRIAVDTRTFRFRLQRLPVEQDNGVPFIAIRDRPANRTQIRSLDRPSYLWD